MNHALPDLRIPYLRTRPSLLTRVRQLVEASEDAGSQQRPHEAVPSIEASGAPVWRRRFEAQRAAFEHGLQLIDAMIALPEALASTEGIG